MRQFMYPVLLIAALLVGSNLQGQKKMEKVSDLDGVEFYASWKPSKMFKKNSVKTLCVKVVNTNDHPVDVGFNVGFYRGGLSIERGAPVAKCIRAGKYVKGKKAGLCWLTADENDDLIQDENVDWEIEAMTVEFSDGCPK